MSVIFLFIILPVILGFLLIRFMLTGIGFVICSVIFLYFWGVPEILHGLGLTKPVPEAITISNAKAGTEMYLSGRREGGFDFVKVTLESTYKTPHSVNLICWIDNGGGPHVGMTYTGRRSVAKTFVLPPETSTNVIVHVKEWMDYMDSEDDDDTKAGCQIRS